LAASIEAQAAPCVRCESPATVDDWHAEARWLDKRAESLTRADRCVCPKCSCRARRAADGANGAASRAL
jgi:hypothetical protein